MINSLSSSTDSKDASQDKEEKKAGMRPDRAGKAGHTDR
jgi:hypothetical protein